MIESVRRIASALVGVALLAFSIVTTYQLASLCAAGQPSCLVAAVSFSVTQDGAVPAQLSGAQSETTPSTAIDAPSMVGFLMEFVQITSLYLMLIGVFIIIVLEFFELRYLRRLVELRHG